MNTGNVKSPKSFLQGGFRWGWGLSHQEAITEGPTRMPIAYPGQVFPEWGEEVGVWSNRELPALTLPQNGHKNKQSQNNLSTTPTIFFCFVLEIKK